MSDYNPTEAKYRITYEAYSKFSSQLSKVNDIDGLIAVVSKNLKYFFSYQIFRIILIENKKTLAYTFTNTNKQYTSSGSSSLLNHEKKIAKTQIPLHTSCKDQELLRFLNNNNDGLDNDKDLWGWYFNYTKIEVITSIVTKADLPLTISDVEILRLVVDTFTTKHKELQLDKQLKLKNENLKEAIIKIEDQNSKIKEINDNQQQIIFDRTDEIRKKNESLVKLSFLNAHSLREPLTRILGLLDLSDELDSNEFKSNFKEYIKESALELDQILNKVIEQSVEAIDQYAIKNIERDEK